MIIVIGRTPASFGAAKGGRLRAWPVNRIEFGYDMFVAPSTEPSAVHPAADSPQDQETEHFQYRTVEHAFIGIAGQTEAMTITDLGHGVLKFSKLGGSGSG